MKKSERALEIAEKIVKAKDELRRMEREFESLFGEPEAVVSNHADNAVALGATSGQALSPASGGSIADRVRRYLAANPNRLVTIADIQQVLPDDTPTKTIRTTVHRLASRGGEIVSVGRGKYKFVGTSQAQ